LLSTRQLLIQGFFIGDKMKLIKKLGTIKSGKKWKRQGLFFCPACKKEVVREKQSGLKSKTCGCSKGLGEYKTRLYNIWGGLKLRCNDNKQERWPDYGGRGITYCEDWEYYINFRNWALFNGYKNDLMIDRINNDGNYEPSNCRFVTNRVNCQNRRCSKLNGEKVKEIRSLFAAGMHKKYQIAEIFNVSSGMISKIILNKSWSNI